MKAADKTAIERAEARRTKAEYDARWWHRHAERRGDSATLDRMREIYPAMFDMAGGLLPSEHIDFRHVARCKVPPERSEAYRRHGIARRPISCASNAA